MKYIYKKGSLIKIVPAKSGSFSVRFIAEIKKTENFIPGIEHIDSGSIVMLLDDVVPEQVRAEDDLFSADVSSSVDVKKLMDSYVKVLYKNKIGHLYISVNDEILDDSM